MEVVNCETGEQSGYVECAVVSTEDVMLHTGRVRFMEQSLPHNIVKSQSRSSTKCFETNHGQAVREPVP